MLTDFRADAARDRDELRADLRARAEHAERQADAYRDELAQLRAGVSHDTDTTTASRTPRRTRQTTYVPSGASPGRNGPFGAVRLTVRDESDTFSAWLMISRRGMRGC